MQGNDKKLSEDRKMSGKELQVILNHTCLASTWRWMGKFREKLGKPKRSPIMKSEVEDWLYRKNF